MAHAMFHDADDNGDEMLDEDELARLLESMYQRMGHKLNADVRARSVEHVREALERFSMAGDAKHLDFKGFLRMLGTSPWRDQMPREVRENLHFATKKHVEDVKWQVPVPHEEPPHATFLKEVKRLFLETDIRRRGRLSARDALGLLMVLKDKAHAASLDEITPQSSTPAGMDVIPFKDTP